MQSATVVCIRIPVTSLEGAIAFYTSVLSFRQISETAAAEGPFGPSRQARLQLGGEVIELVEYAARPGRPIPADSAGHDQWFQHLAIVVSDMAQAYQQLCQNKVQMTSSVPQTIPQSNPAAGGVKAVYFKDPDGHPLELIEFPPDKGDAKWRHGEQLFLGIDHTAIVVFQTEASLAFYRDHLGLSLQAESKNVGPEQENLSGVPGAVVRVSSLKAKAGPGVELLEYLSPPDGRSRPANTQPNDLWAWQIALAVADPAAVCRQLKVAAADAPSPEQLLQDPDGHLVQLIAS